MSRANDRIHTFFVVVEPGYPDRVVVWDTQEVSFGRARENDIASDHVEISRRHAMFSCSGKNFAVQNLSTANGTLVNGEAVATHVLQSGDVVRVGEIELRFYQSAKDPVALGKPLQYSSDLKEFVGPAISADAGGSTVLGIQDTPSGAHEIFEVKAASEFAYDLHGMDEVPHATAPRDLDRELAGYRLDDWDLREESLPRPPMARADGSPGFLELGDDEPRPPAGTLHLEIEGLTGELREILRAFAGKVLELPAVKIRIRDGD